MNFGLENQNFHQHHKYCQIRLLWAKAVDWFVWKLRILLLPWVGICSASIGKKCVWINRPSNWWHGAKLSTYEVDAPLPISSPSDTDTISRFGSPLTLLPLLSLFNKTGVPWHCCCNILSKFEALIRCCSCCSFVNRSTLYGVPLRGRFESVSSFGDKSGASGDDGFGAVGFAFKASLVTLSSLGRVGVRNCGLTLSSCGGALSAFSLLIKN